MILVTGATGFVGQALTKRLAHLPGQNIRILHSPGTDINKMPRNARVSVTGGALDNHGALVNAMDGVHTIFHLIGTDTRGRHAQPDTVDIPGTKAVVAAALEAHVGRIIIISRLGADKGSAFSSLRVKGEIEQIIRNSGLSFTIFRVGVLFGNEDHFSENMAMLCRAFPFYFVPNDGEQILQPLWVEDLVTCLTMCLQDLNTIDRIISIGGPELLSYRRVVMRVMYAAKAKRPIIGSPTLLIKAGAWFLDGLFARWPFTEQWVEMLSTPQAAELGTIERMFGFRPAPFDIGVIDNYLETRRLFVDFIDYILAERW